MAKILFGNGIANMSGKQAGTVYSKNANGAYTRNNRKGVNPNTIRQQLVRSAFRAASRYYSSLSQVQQDSFKDMAINYPYVDRMGNSITYTASQLAAKLASICRSVNFDPLQAECPPPIIMDSVVAVEINLVQVAGVVTSLGADISLRDEEGFPVSNLSRASERLVIYATAALGNGINAPKENSFRKIGTLTEADALNPANISSLYNAVYGLNLHTGVNQIFFKFVVLNTTTPQISAAFMAKAVTTV